MFSTWAANSNQHSSSVWIDRSKEYGTSSDPSSHVHSTDKGIVHSMMIRDTPWEDHHHHSRLHYEDYSSDLNHPSVFDILSNTVNMVSTSLKNSEDNSYLVSTSLKNETRSHEDSSFTKSTSLKNETTPIPNRDFQRSQR